MGFRRANYKRRRCFYKQHRRVCVRACGSFFSLFDYIGYCISDTSVRHLYTEKRTYRWSDVCHVYGTHGVSRLDIPSHKDQGNMRVIRIPYAMLCASGFRRGADFIISRLHDQLDIAAAEPVVAVYGTFAHDSRKCGFTPVSISAT